jgi:hypothetical protein
MVVVEHLEVFAEARGDGFVSLVGAHRATDLFDALSLAGELIPESGAVDLGYAVHVGSRWVGGAWRPTFNVLSSRRRRRGSSR